jgi:nitroreductase
MSEDVRVPVHVPAPWPAPPETGGSDSDRFAWYAAVARWAPSKHNTQPWRFVVRDGTALEIWADPMRMLPLTDPHRRELVISCGAAAELACVAARALGRLPHVTLLPDESGSLLARVTENGPHETSPFDLAMLAAVAVRRTDRGPLDARHLPAALPFRLQTLAAQLDTSLRLVSREGDRATLARLVERADRLLAQRGTVDRELIPWLREPGDHRGDGVPTDHTRGAAASARAEFVQRDFSTHHSRPAHDRPDPDHPMVAVLCTPEDSVVDWLHAGRALGAVLLEAATEGASASYLNQPVEEPAIRAELRDQLALPGIPQLVLRMGVGGAVPPTPRRDPDELTFRS